MEGPSLVAALQAAKYAEMERQLNLFRHLVLQSNHVLVDVHAALRGLGDRQTEEKIGGLRRRIEHLLDRQTTATKPEDSSGERLAFSAEDVAAAPAVAPTRSGAPEGISASHASASAAVAERLVQATGRIADSWLENKARTVEAALELPRDAFAAFDTNPTDDSLQDFLTAFREATSDITNVLAKTDDSPFRGTAAAKITSFVADMISQGMPQVVPEVVTKHGAVPHAATSAPATTKGEDAPKPPLMPSSARPVAPQGAAGVPAGQPSTAPVTAGAGRTRAVAPTGHWMHGSESSTVAPSRAGGLQRPSYAGADSQPLHTPSAAVGVPTRGRASETPRTAAVPLPLPLSAAALALPPASLPSSSVTPTPRSATPSRFSGVPHDSSQMRAVFGANDALSVPRGAQAAANPEIAALQSQLAQLEMQISLATGRRESGNEAKFYALNKKIQLVRAELLRAQRAEAEDVAIREAIAQQRKVRDTNRRTFGH